MYIWCSGEEPLSFCCADKVQPVISKLMTQAEIIRDGHEHVQSTLYVSDYFRSVTGTQSSAIERIMVLQEMVQTVLINNISLIST